MLLVNCVPRDMKILSAYFLIPVGLIWRRNHLTAQIREITSVATKALEENFRSKREEPTEIRQSFSRRLFNQKS